MSVVSAFIAEQKAAALPSVELVCRTLGVSRSAHLIATRRAGPIWSSGISPRRDPDRLYVADFTYLRCPGTRRSCACQGRSKIDPLAPVEN